MTNFHKTIEEICARDTRYKPDSYEFILQALNFTQQKLKNQGHVSGKELAQGCAEFAIEQYGPMAKAVLTYWGVTKTQDFGNIVYNMIEAKLFSRTESDSINDFKDVYNFDIVFANVLGKKWTFKRYNPKKSLQSPH